MATVSMTEGAKLVGRSKGTLSKAVACGRLPIVEKTRQGYLIDRDELERVFPSRNDEAANVRSPNDGNSRSVDETRLLRMERDFLRQQLHDLRADRDAWRLQAQRLAEKS